jgi:hypothetical protein
MGTMSRIKKSPASVIMTVPSSTGLRESGLRETLTVESSSMDGQISCWTWVCPPELESSELVHLVWVTRRSSETEPSKRSSQDMEIFVLLRRERAALMD